MSGGSLDYVESRIFDAAGKVREWIRARNEGPHPKRSRNPLVPPEKDVDSEWAYDWTPHPYYAEKYKGKPFVKSAAALKKATLKRLEATARQLDLAARLAHEAEWMFDDDTGPETFCMMFDKLVKMHKAGKCLADGAEEPETEP